MSYINSIFNYASVVRSIIGKFESEVFCAASVNSRWNIASRGVKPFTSVREFRHNYFRHSYFTYWLRCNVKYIQYTRRCLKSVRVVNFIIGKFEFIHCRGDTVPSLDTTEYHVILLRQLFDERRVHGQSDFIFPLLA